MKKEILIGNIEWTGIKAIVGLIFFVLGTVFIILIIGFVEYKLIEWLFLQFEVVLEPMQIFAIMVAIFWIKSIFKDWKNNDK